MINIHVARKIDSLREEIIALEKKNTILMEGVDTCYCDWGKAYPDTCGNCEALEKVKKLDNKGE